MSKIYLFAVLALCALVIFTQARDCYYSKSYALCPWECCGKEDSLQCLSSCYDVNCSLDEDCGSSGCCSNGKCADCESQTQETYISCSYDCPGECCNTENGVCSTGIGCLSLHSKCSLNDDCASNCCYKDQCRGSQVCALNSNDNEQPTDSEHNSGSRSTTHVSWRTPVIVIVVILAVVVKITIWVLWSRRRSRTRVVVVRTGVVPHSTVQVSGHAHEDSVPFLSQDEEQFKYEQPPPQYTATA